MNLPVEQRYMDLTGGKDSRLLLAVAVGAGMADQFMIQTAGPGDLRDVEIASGLTSLLGLDHRTGFLWPIDRRPYPEQVATFVELTTGTVNLWDLKLPRSSPAELRVSGMTGECLRAYVPLPATPSDDRRLLEIVRMKFLRGTLPLLLPETRFTLDRELEAALLEPDIACDDPLDRLGSFMIRNRARRPRGSMDELETDFRVWPLASLPAVRAAFALGSERRQGEYVHRKLIERHSTELAEYAFAGPGWSASAEGPKAAPSDPPAISPTAAPNRQKSEPVLKRGHRQLRDMRKTLLETVFADTRNPIWDLVDRNAAVSGLATFDELSMKQLRQLCAVGTAALWLAT